MEPLPLFAGDGTDAALFSSLWSFQDDLHQQPQEVYSSPSLLLQHFLACSKQWLVDSRVCCRDGRRRSRPRFPFHSLWSRGVRQPTGEGFETPWHVTYWNSLPFPNLSLSLVVLHVRLASWKIPSFRFFLFRQAFRFSSTQKAGYCTAVRCCSMMALIRPRIPVRVSL
jgi:hypothetical protein